MKLKAPRGTQDILPDRSAAWLWLETAFRGVLHGYGFHETRTPVFEVTELFQRGVGESTDIVQKEMYTFADRKGRSLTLRPEGTASVARAYAEHNLQAGPRPFKTYYMGPMFRYERPQAGRYRQHQQIGAEVIGAGGPEADFEVISLFTDLLAAVGLTGLSVKLNSVGDADCRPQYVQAVRDHLASRDSELTEDMRRQLDMNPLRILDSKDPKAKEITANLPGIQQFLNQQCRDHQERLLDLLRGAGIEVDLDQRLVRGLDYYTKTVFEIQHGGLGAQSAVGGGGRYDNLVREVGGPDVPAVGFSSGVERILLALEAEGVDLPQPLPPQVAVVVAGDDAERRAAQLLARRLRRILRVDVDLMGRGLGGQMRAADKAGATLAIVVGSGELADGTWTVKNMKSGDQATVADGDLETYLAEELGEGTEG